MYVASSSYVASKLPDTENTVDIKSAGSTEDIQVSSERVRSKVISNVLIQAFEVAHARPARLLAKSNDVLLAMSE